MFHRIANFGSSLVINMFICGVQDSVTSRYLRPECSQNFSRWDEGTGMQESRDPTIPRPMLCISAARDCEWPRVEILVEIMKPALAQLGKGGLYVDGSESTSTCSSFSHILLAPPFSSSQNCFLPFSKDLLLLFLIVCICVRLCVRMLLRVQVP